MSTNLEIEAQSIINEEEYKKVLAFLNLNVKPIIQTNYYIDSEDNILYKHKYSLRMRVKDYIEMTLKIKLSDGQHIENNILLNEQEFNNFLEKKEFPENDIRAILENDGIDISKLQVLTFLKTSRIEVELDKGYLLAIDKNEYNNKIDYELEVESNNLEDGINYLKALCKNAKINYVPNHDSKQKRAIESMKK